MHSMISFKAVTVMQIYVVQSGDSLVEIARRSMLSLLLKLWVMETALIQMTRPNQLQFDFSRLV